MLEKTVLCADKDYRIMLRTAMHMLVHTWEQVRTNCFFHYRFAVGTAHDCCDNKVDRAEELMPVAMRGTL